MLLAACHETCHQFATASNKYTLPVRLAQSRGAHTYMQTCIYTYEDSVYWLCFAITINQNNSANIMQLNQWWP